MMQIFHTVAYPWVGAEVQFVVQRDEEARVEGSERSRETGIVELGVDAEDEGGCERCLDQPAECLARLAVVLSYFGLPQVCW